MLTEKESGILPRVGPGTPMGELMRRDRQPFAAVAEMDENPAKPVRVLGEPEGGKGHDAGSSRYLGETGE